jgi:hypothetical protein
VELLGCRPDRGAVDRPFRHLRLSANPLQGSMMAGFGPLWALVGPRFLPVDSTDWDSTFTRSRALRPVQEQTGGP